MEPNKSKKPDKPIEDLNVLIQELQTSLRYYSFSSNAKPKVIQDKTRIIDLLQSIYERISGPLKGLFLDILKKVERLLLEDKNLSGVIIHINLDENDVSNHAIIKVDLGGAL